MPARLSLGTAQFGLPYGPSAGTTPLSRQEVHEILATALDFGIKTLDTAAAYGDAEEKIGDFLKRNGHRHEINICTKLAPVGSRDADFDITGFVRRNLDDSRKKLGIDRIPTYSVHHATDLAVYGRRLVEALLEEHRQDRIGTIGLSVYDPEESEWLFEYAEVEVVQHPLSLLDRRLIDSGLLQRLEGHRTAVHTRSTMLQGLLVMDPDHLPDYLTIARKSLVTLRRILDSWGLKVIDVALPFVAQTPGVSRVVIGVQSAHQLRQIVASLFLEIPRQLLETLDRHLADVPIEVIDPRRWKSAGA